MMNSNILNTLFTSSDISEDLIFISNKVIKNERITVDEGILLFEKAEIGFLSLLADYVRYAKNQDYTYFNRNIHIEPTNICIHNCIFCSYSRKAGQDGAWDYSVEEILDKVKEYVDKSITEIHIVGGVHPNHDLFWYGELLSRIKEIIPTVHIKAFTAVEIEFMAKKAGLSIEEGLKKLQGFGLGSIPGGGAEIFDPGIRVQVCGDKSSAEQWLNVHETAHKLGIPSNATILYGHIENYAQRVDHLNRLRELQDRTGGFNTFIPLKYRKQNNKLSHIGEVSIIEDLKNFAVSRIFLDNFPHIKAYWPAFGKSTSQLSLSFGVDDIDGTIDDSTKIYSMSGAEDKSPKMNTDEIVSLIKSAKRIPVERDTLYNVVQVYH